MKKISYLLLLLIAFVACTPQKNQITIQKAEIGEIRGVRDDQILYAGQTVELSATIEGQNVQFIWILDGTRISTDQTFTHTLQKAGRQSLKLELRNDLGSDSREISFNVLRPVQATSSKWVSRIVEFRPAPGQFINKNPGNMASAEGIVGKRGMVSLGGYGGYIVLGFDHTILNRDGVDFVVHGNAFENNSESGIVMVAYDANGNGEADQEEWFELQGSVYDKSTKNFEITYTRPSQIERAQDVLWQANDGTKGAIHTELIAPFHQQCFYPLFLKDDPSQLLFTGTLLPKMASQDPNTGLWSVATIAGGGYADNYSEDYSQIIDQDKDTNGSNKFDISKAIDSNGGKVSLKGIDFVKVYTALNEEAGWLGEVSTEVCGAISLTVK